MKKFKGQGTFTKMLASKIGAFNKKKFIHYVNSTDNLKNLCNELGHTKISEIDVVSFSSNRDFSEQVLSILSFIKNIGTPNQWLIYSDGTHTNEQVHLLESSFIFLKLIKIDAIDKYVHSNIKLSLAPYEELLISYATAFPLGKRLFLYLNHPIARPTLFIDSDIIFYEKAFNLKNLISSDNAGWFLPDADSNNLDSRYINDIPSQQYQVNGGMFIITKDIPLVAKGLDFLKNLNGKYQYFSDQTVLHIILTENNFTPLDPRVFALNSGDQFDFSYLYSKEAIAIRHYTGPVRHKMWQKDWRWHLSIS